jgi:hypothetical protein
MLNVAATKTKKGAAEATPKTLTATPSGIQIAYFTEPKRMYKIRQGEPGMDSLVYSPEEDWAEVPSVTTVLDVLGKDALSWWGMRVGIKGMFKLWDMGLVTFTTDGALAATVDAVWQLADCEDGGNIEQLLKQNKLTVNDVKSDAGERGQSAHDALEAWAIDTSFRPDPNDYPPEEWPYLVALCKFIEDMGDAWETEGVEVAVGSAEHGFAGRYDLRGRVLRDVKLVNRTLTIDGKGLLKKGASHIILPAGTKCLLDAKTSKSVYPTHLMQLEAYEGAGIECGYSETDMRAVIHLAGLHGEYQFFPAKASYADFLDLIPAYHAVQRVKEVLAS